MRTARFSACGTGTVRYDAVSKMWSVTSLRCARIKVFRHGTVAFNRVWPDLVGIPTARLRKIVPARIHGWVLATELEGREDSTMPSKNYLIIYISALAPVAHWISCIHFIHYIFATYNIYAYICLYVCCTTTFTVYICEHFIRTYMYDIYFELYKVANIV